MSDKKEQYKIEMEVMAPVTLVFKIWATSPEEALEIVKLKDLANQPKPNLLRMKKIKATVKQWLQMNVLYTKKY